MQKMQVLFYKQEQDSNRDFYFRILIFSSFNLVDITFRLNQVHMVTYAEHDQKSFLKKKKML